MSGTAGGGDNYTGLGDDWGIDPSTSSWMADHAGTPTWDPSGTWDLGQNWWQRNTPTPETLAQLRTLQGGLSALKPLPDPNAASVRGQFPAVPGIPPTNMHAPGAVDALQQYLQALQQRQQALRTQFLPRTAGLLGG
jgi:hypothetical protein